MKKYNQKIVIRNYVVPKEYYDNMKEYLEGYLKYLAEEILDWDFTLNVYIVKNKREGQEASVVVHDKKYRLYIYESLMLKLNHGEKRFFDYALMHEVFHLLDFQYALDCKYTKAKVNKELGSTKKEFYIIKGFQFWTEVNAYEVAFHGFNKRDVEYPTTFKVLKSLKRLDSFADEINAYKGKAPQKMYNELKEKVENLSYDFTKYIAKRRLFGKREKYSKKTKSNLIFKEIKRFTKDIEEQLKIIDKAPFCEDFDKNFGDLGKLLFAFFYEPLCFELYYYGKKMSLTSTL